MTRTSPSHIVLGRRKTPAQFILTEFLIYLCSTAVFYLVAAFDSRLFKDETRLLAFIKAKIESDPLAELTWTLVAVSVVFTALVALEKGLSGAPSAFVKEVAHEVLGDFPRLVYAMGGSIGGLVYAAATFISGHPTAGGGSPLGWLLLGLLTSSIFFVLGLAASLIVKKKTHLLP